MSWHGVANTPAAGFPSAATKRGLRTSRRFRRKSARATWRVSADRRVELMTLDRNTILSLRRPLRGRPSSAFLGRRRYPRTIPRPRRDRRRDLHPTACSGARPIRYPARIAMDRRARRRPDPSLERCPRRARSEHLAPGLAPRQRAPHAVDHSNLIPTSAGQACAGPNWRGPKGAMTTALITHIAARHKIAAVRIDLAFCALSRAARSKPTLDIGSRPVRVIALISACGCDELRRRYLSITPLIKHHRQPLTTTVQPDEDEKLDILRLSLAHLACRRCAI